MAYAKLSFKNSVSMNILFNVKFKIFGSIEFIEKSNIKKERKKEREIGNVKVLSDEMCWSD